jgi:hypothetical protein
MESTPTAGTANPSQITVLGEYTIKVEDVPYQYSHNLTPGNEAFDPMFGQYETFVLNPKCDKSNGSERTKPIKFRGYKISTFATHIAEDDTESFIHYHEDLDPMIDTDEITNLMVFGKPDPSGVCTVTGCSTAELKIPNEPQYVQPNTLGDTALVYGDTSIPGKTRKEFNLRRLTFEPRDNPPGPDGDEEEQRRQQQTAEAYKYKISILDVQELGSVAGPDRNGTLTTYTRIPDLAPVSTISTVA